MIGARIGFFFLSGLVGTERLLHRQHFSFMFFRLMEFMARVYTFSNQLWCFDGGICGGKWNTEGDGAEEGAIGNGISGLNGNFKCNHPSESVAFSTVITVFKRVWIAFHAILFHLHE